MSQHCNIVAKNVDCIQGYINSKVICKSQKLILPLYLALMKPHQEYCVQFWAPHLSKDVEKLERVQGTATKLLGGLGNMPCEETLVELGLSSLQKRRQIQI